MTYKIKKQTKIKLIKKHKHEMSQAGSKAERKLNGTVKA